MKSTRWFFLISLAIFSCCFLAGLAIAQQDNADNDSTNFNVKVDLPEAYRIIIAGDELWFTNHILNLANNKRVDITVTYQIYDEPEDILYSKTETLAVETQASFVGHLQTPNDLKSGLHFLTVTVQSTYGVSKSQTTFRVVQNMNHPNWLVYGLVIIIIAVFIFLFELKYKKITSALQQLQIRMEVKSIVNQRTKKRRQ